MAGQLDDISRAIGQLQSGLASLGKELETATREGRRRESMLGGIGRQIEDRMSELRSAQAAWQHDFERKSDVKHQANIERFEHSESSAIARFEHVEGRLDSIDEERRVARAVRDHRWWIAKIIAGILGAMAAAATVWEVIAPWFRSKP